MEPLLPVTVSCRWATSREPLSVGNTPDHRTDPTIEEDVRRRLVAQHDATKCWFLLRDLLLLHDTADVNYG